MSEPIPTPLPILVSALALQNEGAAIAAAVQSCTAGQRQVRWITDCDAATTPRTAEVAYITRDVTAGSTKDMILPDTERFYAAMRASPALAWVHTHSSGADRYIFNEMRQRNVRVTTSTGSNAQPVAQTALAAVLMLGRRFLDLLAAQRQREWRPLLNHPDVHDLAGRTAMVVGLGPVGQEIARLLKAVGMGVIGVTRDTSAARHAGTLDALCTYGEIASHLSRTDYLVLACPLSPLTRHLVNARALALLPRGACVVNVARGEVVVQAALIEALQTGHLGGAFLDVFEPEPLASDSVLWQLPNVMISPHTAGHFAEHAQRVHALFVHNLQRYLASQPLRHESA